MWWCRRPQYRCLVPATALQHAGGKDIFSTSHCCIFGAWGTITVKEDWKCSTLWHLLPCRAQRPNSTFHASVASKSNGYSQQQRQFQVVLIAPTPRPPAWGRPLSIWIIKKTMYIQVSDSDHLFLLKIIRPMNSKILMNLYTCHLGYWAVSMTLAVSVSWTQWWIFSTRSEVVGCPVSTQGHLSILPHTVQTQTHILAKTINLESLATSILTNR